MATKKTTVHVIACAVLALDLKKAAKELGIKITADFLPAGLHNEPHKLRQKLQAAIDDASKKGSCQRIAIGYGLCGMGTVNIQARQVPLFIPRVHDCIAMFLGGSHVYKEQFANFPGTYYFSAGWLTEKAQPLSQGKERAWMGHKSVTQEDLEKQYRPDQAREIMTFLSSWKKNYQRAVFIDTGVDQKKRHETYAQKVAQKNGWQYERLQGDPGLLQKLLTLKTGDGDVLRVAPSHITLFDTIHHRLDCASVRSTNTPPSPMDKKDSPIKPPSKTPPVTYRYGLGIDAGGTYTDAVIYDLKTDALRCKNKTLTTRWDFCLGVKAALDGLDADLLKQVELAALSTTMATNAIVEGAGQKVGLLLMPPYGVTDTGQADLQPKTVIQGRLGISGREIEPVNSDEIRQTARQMVVRHGVSAFAVSGFAGTINPAQELLAKEIILAETGLSVTCGHELSQQLDFKTRARTAVLNARIIPRLEKLIKEIEVVLRQMGIKAPMVVVKGDGSLISAQIARNRPVETILSGPSASVAGARHLTQTSNAVVVDIGGTTTDIAAVKNGRVPVLASGATVGGHHTHVMALEMQTCGLGGDSAINWQKGSLFIGPQRVAPVAWLGRRTNRLQKAFSFLESRLDYYRTDTRPMTLLTANGSISGLKPTPNEKTIHRLLTERPYSMDELARKMNYTYWRLLPLERLEEHGVLQRCGLTPSDLLHVTGCFKRWDIQSAQQWYELMRAIIPHHDETSAEYLLDQVTQQMAVEILKSQLGQTSNADPKIDQCVTCSALIENWLTGGNDQFHFRLALRHPIIGIGAPAGHFIPRAGKLLGAQTIIPVDADVANAIGAITSHVKVEQQVSIRPDERGQFVIEGIEGALSFKDFDEACAFSEQALRRKMILLGRKAGTSQSDIEIKADDRIAHAADGSRLFLGRTLTARIEGRPDPAVPDKAVWSTLP